MSFADGQAAMLNAVGRVRLLKAALETDCMKRRMMLGVVLLAAAHSPLAVESSLPRIAAANNFRLVPNVAFEHRSYERGGEDYIARVSGSEIVFRPDDRILAINSNEIHLNESTYTFLNDADLSEVSIYASLADKSFICIEFGFGGLLRSGSFKQIKGILVLQTHNKAELVVHYC